MCLARVEIYKFRQERQSVCFADYRNNETVKVHVSPLFGMGFILIGNKIDTWFTRTNEVCFKSQICGFSFRIVFVILIILKANKCNNYTVGLTKSYLKSVLPRNGKIYSRTDVEININSGNHGQK